LQSAINAVSDPIGQPEGTKTPYNNCKVPTFIELLEGIAAANPVISISASQLDALAMRFGDRVRQMGRWNVSTDGSLDIPAAVIHEAAMDLDGQRLHDALREIKAEAFNELLESSPAVLLIDRIRDAYERHVRRIMDRYQGTASASEAAQLRDQLVREIFGQ
jgi:hypothetical protein